MSVYSARRYRSDAALFAGFTARTGVRVSQVDGREDELLDRIRREGANGPADVLITVDAARLGHADALGLFQPLRSRVLETRIPAALRTARWAALDRSRPWGSPGATLRPAIAAHKVRLIREPRSGASTGSSRAGRDREGERQPHSSRR